MEWLRTLQETTTEMQRAKAKVSPMPKR